MRTWCWWCWMFLKPASAEGDELLRLAEGRPASVGNKWDIQRQSAGIRGKRSVF